jgi:hypothetical protein
MITHASIPPKAPTGGKVSRITRRYFISPAIVAAEKNIAILFATSRLLYQRDK